MAAIRLGALKHRVVCDPTVLMAGDQASATDIGRLRHTLGFDRPLIVQCGDFVWHVLRGDFGQSLSFLGLGVQPPTPTWGSMLADSRDYLTRANGACALSGGSRRYTASPQGRRRVRACRRGPYNVLCNPVPTPEGERTFAVEVW